MATTPTPAPGAPTPSTPEQLAAQINERNAREHAIRTGQKPPEKQPAPEPKAKAAPAGNTEKPEEDGETLEQSLPKMSRSARREINKYREEAAELRGRLKAFEELGVKPKAAETAKPGDAAADTDDPEPTRDKFATDSEFDRALGRWEARQEAKKVVTESQASEKEVSDLQKSLDSMAAKKWADADLIPDWDDAAKRAESMPELQCDWKEHRALQLRLLTSDTQAAICRHWVDHPEDFQSLLALSGDIVAQDRAFTRLEGRVEKLYTTGEPTGKKVAPAADPKKSETKGSTHPAEGEKPGRNSASENDARKPKPSSEVAAPGGSRVPDAPLPGTKEWVAMRNEQKFRRAHQ